MLKRLQLHAKFYMVFYLQGIPEDIILVPDFSPGFGRTEFIARKTAHAIEETNQSLFRENYYFVINCICSLRIKICHYTKV